MSVGRGFVALEEADGVAFGILADGDVAYTGDGYLGLQHTAARGLRFPRIVVYVVNMDVVDAGMPSKGRPVMPPSIPGPSPLLTRR